MFANFSCKVTKLRKKTGMKIKKLSFVVKKRVGEVSISIILANFAVEKGIIYEIIPMARMCVVALVVSVVMFAACKHGRQSDGGDVEDVVVAEEMSDSGEESLEELIADEPMPTSADELFDDFFFNFASNKRLQLERIHFPLRVTSSAGTDTIGRSAWKMDRFFMRQGTYTLIFDRAEQMERVKDTAVSEATVERIDLIKMQVRQYLFSRKSGRWMLGEERQQALADNPNASFLTFYSRFATDSLFQTASLCQEIDFVGPNPDDDFSSMEGVITPDFWNAFAPELPQGTIYNIVYGAQDARASQKVFVIRGIANGLEIELTFQRERGSWKLKKLVE